MKKKINLMMPVILMALLVFPSLLKAANEVVEDVEPNVLFVPVGFDDNDEVVAVVDGYLADTCYKLRSPEVTIDPVAQKVLVQPRAAKFPDVCMDMIVPYTQVVRIGTLPRGIFTIQTRSGKIHERLEVKKATTSNPDDYLYAPVDSIQVKVGSGGKTRATLFGRFTNSCLKMKEHKLTVSGKTLELLPIMMRTSGTCQLTERPFEYVVELPELPAGRYLLHVRSLNGQSVNEVFTNHW